MCPKSSFLKCVEFRENGHFRTFFRNFGGREKFQEISVRKVSFWKISCEIFCRNRLYLCDVKPEKTAKKDGFRNFGVSGIFGTDFSEIFRFIPITLILPVYPVAQSVFCEKHRKCTNFFGISNFGNQEPKFPRGFFFRGFLFQLEFQIGPNFFEIYIVPLLKWHITLRFSEKPEKTRGFPGTLPVIVPESFQGKCRGMRHGNRIEKTSQNYEVHESAQPGFEKILRIFEITGTVSREFP
jgi:hypothetical protein